MGIVNGWPLSLHGSSKAAEIIKHVVWEDTTIGSLHLINCELKGVINMMLSSSFPMIAWFGSDATQLYNDAAADFMKDFPQFGGYDGMGISGAMVWTSHWSNLSEKIAYVKREKKALHIAYDLFPKYIGSTMRYVFCKLTFDPIFNDKGEVTGVLCIFVEKQVMNLQSDEKDKDYIFLTDLGARMASLGNDIREVETLRSLGEHFSCHRVGVAHLIEDSSRVVIKECYEDDGLPSIAGEYFLDDFHDDLNKNLSKGEIVLESYVDESEVLSAIQKKNFAELAIGSVLNIPLFENNKLTAIFFFHFRHAYHWSEQDIQFLSLCATRFWDVSCSVKAYENMVRNERYYMSLVNSFDQAFMVIDFVFDVHGSPTDYEFMHVNPAFEKQTGLKQVVGKRIKEIMPDVEQSWIDKYGSVAVSGRPIRFEEFNAATAGWYDVYATPMESKKGQVVVVFNDITMRKLEDDRKTDFLSMASHELKTPLTSLKAYLDISERKIKRGDYSTVSTMLERAGGQLQRMMSIISGFLNVNELEKGRLRFDLTSFDAVSMMKDIESDAAINYLTHKYRYEGCSSLYIYTDRNKLQQVIINLVNNAVKYSPAGTQITLHCERDGNSAKLGVCDEGVGIEESERKRIFERFYRVESPKNQGVSGFGIGLFLCKEIVEGLGGNITVHDNNNKGSLFLVTLPQKDF